MAGAARGRAAAAAAGAARRAEGEVIGPFPLDDGHAVALIERKAEPDAADPVVADRARTRALERRWRERWTRRSCGMSASDTTAPGEVPAALENLPLLAAMPADMRRLVAQTFESRSYGFGKEIVSEGDDADAFYVVVSGRARVVKLREDGKEIAVNTLEPGDSFGEFALVERSERTATVRASEDVEVLRLERAVFDALVRTHPGGAHPPRRADRPVPRA